MPHEIWDVVVRLTQWKDRDVFSEMWPLSYNMLLSVSLIICFALTPALSEVSITVTLLLISLRIIPPSSHTLKSMCDSYNLIYNSIKNSNILMNTFSPGDERHVQ